MKSQICKHNPIIKMNSKYSCWIYQIRVIVVDDDSTVSSYIPFRHKHIVFSFVPRVCTVSNHDLHSYIRKRSRDHLCKGDKTKRIKVEWEIKRGKRWFTKGLRMMGEMRGKNETLHSLYICFTFGLDLNGVWRVLLYIGAENVMFWAVLTTVWGISWASGRVWLLMWVLYRLDMEMGAGVA